MQGRISFIAIALLCLFAGAAWAQDSDGYDFRKTKWGMTPAQVKASESMDPTAQGGTETYDLIILYSVSVAGLNTQLGYHFVSNKLVSGAYIIQESYVNRNQHIADYNKIKEILTRKYGPPSTDDVVWNNDLFKDDPQNYGTAVATGHLAYQSTWETPDTEIKLTLRGENFKVLHGVMYEDKKSKSLIESREKAGEEKDF